MPAVILHGGPCGAVRALGVAARVRCGCSGGRDCSAEARAGTDGLPAVRAARRAGARRTLPAAQRARREQMEEKARAAGYTSMADAIRATRDLSSRAAAARIGIDPATVRRWRGLDS